MARILNKIFATAASAACLALSQPAFAGDAAEGAKVFKANCAICHATTKSAPPGIGPRLNNVVGRTAGTMQGFAYSPAMKEFGLPWSADELKTYLTDPQKLVHGNRMPFAGLHNPTDRDNVVSYLATLH
jgi:cytochrome c